MSIREENFEIIKKTELSLRDDELHPEVDATFLSLGFIKGNRIEIDAPHPNTILGPKSTEIGAHCIFPEPETGIADLSFSTNVSEHCSLIGKELTSEVGFLTTKDTVNLHNDLGLIAGIENTNCGLGISGDMLVDKPNGEILSLENQGVALNKSIYEIGSLASCNTGILKDTSLGFIDGGNELLVADASLGYMFFGSKLTGEASFLGTSENTVLGVGMDSDYELGAINQVGVSNIQVENNFNLIDADLRIGIDVYKSSERLDYGIISTDNGYQIDSNSTLDVVDKVNVFSNISGMNQIQTVDFLSMKSEDEFDTVLLEHPYFEDEEYKELKNIYSQFQNSMDSGNISHFMQYAEVGNKTIKIYCMNLKINIDGDLIGSYHIGDNYTLKIESNE